MAVRLEDMAQASCEAPYRCGLSSELAARLAAVPEAESLVQGLQASPNLETSPSLLGPDLGPLTRVDCTAERRETRCRKSYRLILRAFEIDGAQPTT